MSDAKMAALNAPARAVFTVMRFTAGLTAMARLKLAFLAARPVTSARAD